MEVHSRRWHSFAPASSIIGVVLDDESLDARAWPQANDAKVLSAIVTALFILSMVGQDHDGRLSAIPRAP